jgi:cobalt-zinc-cadmium efflux system outer membrane protein
VSQSSTLLILPAAALLVTARPAGAQTAMLPPSSPAAVVLTLGQVVDSAVARYPAVEAARARARAARGARTTAGVLGNPMLAYQVENAPFPGGAPVTGMARENMTTATLPLAPLYQRGARVRQADAAVRAADADARAARQRVALDAARAYYRTAVATVSADAAENLARWLDSVVAYNRTRVSQGVAAEADLIRSQLERDRAAADAGMEAAELARARADLAAFVGDPETASLELAVALEDAPLAMPAPTPSGAVPAAAAVAAGTTSRTRTTDAPITAAPVDRRPDVLAARERLSAASAGVAVEQRMIIRELGATLGVKQSAGTSSMVAGVSVPLPLFDQNRGELTRARAEHDAAGFDLAARERTARAEVIGAEAAACILTERAGVLAARDSAGRGAAYLARADEARAIALGAYREGAVSLLQVLDAARAWGEARVAYYRTLYAQHEAVLALLVARGDDLAAALPTLTPAPLAPSRR